MGCQNASFVAGKGPKKADPSLRALSRAVKDEGSAFEIIPLADR